MLKCEFILADRLDGATVYYQRTLKNVWLDASGQFPVLLLTGPRQVGKTTFLRHSCDESRRYVTLDDPATRSLANDDPELFMKRYESPLLIDEIQYAPNLMSYIKMAVDASNKPGEYWLTGSQQFTMMKGITETLAGRIGILNMLGFSERERTQTQLNAPPFLPERQPLKKRLAFAKKPVLKSVFKKIWQGNFPALIAGEAKNRDLYYSSYLQTYLLRDVRDLTQVGNERTFLKFIRACAARTGHLLNLSDIANDTDVSVPTAKKWLSILQASFQVVLLQPYHSNITKRLVKTPKLFFLDTGLCSYLTEWATPETLEAGAMAGAVFETYVFTEILKSYWHQGFQPLIYYYRDKDKKEIDLIIEQNQTLYPIEIKKGGSPKKEWIRHLSVLSKFNRKIGDGIVICMTSEATPLDNKNTALPVTVL
ncbi:MAG: ATPase [Planctomycetales bacterium 4572_13]|nr:MAG: ATPase [Planctomycetales bacterium 4572_13]